MSGIKQGVYHKGQLPGLASTVHQVHQNPQKSPPSLQMNVFLISTSISIQILVAHAWNLFLGNIVSKYRLFKNVYWLLAKIGKVHQSTSTEVH